MGIPDLVKHMLVKNSYFTYALNMQILESRYDSCTNRIAMPMIF